MYTSIWVLFSCLGYIPRNGTMILCLTFWGIAKRFSLVAVPFSISTSNVVQFEFLHVLSSTYFHFRKAIYWMWDGTRCGFDLHSLMTNDVPLFMWLLAVCFFVEISILFFLFFLLLRATCTAYGSSWARGQIRAAAAGPRHSHGNTGSKQHLWLMPQLVAMLDP